MPARNPGIIAKILRAGKIARIRKKKEKELRRKLRESGEKIE